MVDRILLVLYPFISAPQISTVVISSDRQTFFFPLHRDYAGFILNWDSGKTFTYHLMLDDDQDWEGVDARSAIERVLGTSTHIDVISIQPWTAHALVADQYQYYAVLFEDHYALKSV